MTPIVNRLTGEFAGRVAVQQFNVERPEDAAVQAQYDLRGHPTIALINQDGEKVQQFFGVVDETALRAALEALAP